MNVYLASVDQRPWIPEIIYSNSYVNDMYYPLRLIKKNNITINTLISFFYQNNRINKMIPYFDNLLLDSGAFTFMNNEKKDINWGNYIDNYIDFINKYDIKHFFELDIDCIVGYEKVKEMRKYIENKTNKKSIPVWHKSRGLDEFINLSQQYNYIAIGGIVTKEITKKEYPYFNKLLKIAKENECKVHGLGFTSLKNLKKYRFYSVDSSSWTYGERLGSIYKFNQNKIIMYNKPNNKRISNSKKIAVNNFCEWVKFANYMKQF